MADNITRLARTINRRIHVVSSGKIDVIAEPGEIGGGKALYVPSVDGKIPKEYYTVAGSVGTLQSGDEVLVIWTNNEPIIIGNLSSDGGSPVVIDSITEADIDALFT